MKTVAILTGPQTHLDHLGVLSTLLKIPLIVTDEKNLELAHQFYPDLQPTLIPFDELSLEYLATHYDLIFETGKFFAAELKPAFELLFGKKMGFVFCPHGNSDKGHSLHTHVAQDISLVYGDHLQTLLEQNGAAEKINHTVRTGNYRYHYYCQHKPFFDKIAHEKVFSRFKEKKPVLFYAPTYTDHENTSSFFSATERLIKELSIDYNLLIKLHPFLIEHQPAHTFALMARHEEDPNTLFLSDYPPIYPLLAGSDLYLGDYSSIGYDYLAFDKPLYFFNPQHKSSPLQQCGVEIPLDPLFPLKEFLEETLKESHRFSTHRKRIYLHAFGAIRSPDEIREEIFQKSGKEKDEDQSQS